jgi:hypothetical protein
MPEVQIRGVSKTPSLERVPTVSITHPGHRSSILAVLRSGRAHYNAAAEVDRIVQSMQVLLQ